MQFFKYFFPILHFHNITTHSSLHTRHFIENKRNNSSNSNNNLAALIFDRWHVFFFYEIVNCHLASCWKNFVRYVQSSLEINKFNMADYEDHKHQESNFHEGEGN